MTTEATSRQLKHKIKVEEDRWQRAVEGVRRCRFKSRVSYVEDEGRMRVSGT